MRILREMLCHGVSNSKLTESYLRGCEKLYGKKISGYSFRNKGRKFGTDRSSFAEFRFADGSKKKIDHDILYWGFIKGLFIRESCGSCRFSGKERAADFTIADFWGIERLSEEFSTGRGCSLVCANTKRAAKLLPEIAALGKAKKFEIAQACEYVGPLKGAREPAGAPRAEFCGVVWQQSRAERRGFCLSVKKWNCMAFFCVIYWIQCVSNRPAAGTGRAAGRNSGGKWDADEHRI